MRAFTLPILAGLILTTVGVDAAEQKPPPDGFSFAAVGDIIYLRPSLAALEKKSAPLLDVLRTANVTFGNFESNAFPLATFRGSLQSQLEGPALLTTIATLHELRAMGFDLVSHANNHTFDFGTEGVKVTNSYFGKAGLAYAGSGADLRSARSPGYMVTKGVRVALVAVTSSYFEASPAADAWGPVKARPGVSALRVQTKMLVTPQDFATLRNLSTRLSNTGGTTTNSAPPSAEVKLLGQTFKTDDAPRDHAGYSYLMDETDRRGILAAVTDARNSASVVMFSLHTHQPTSDPTAPPDFVISLAHAVIDAGADVFIAHGPHQLRGIEIYRDKPIFYSLANFAIMQPSPDINPTPLIFPPGSLFTQRAFFESVIAVGRYSDGRLSAIELHPFELANTGELSSQGLPQPVAEPVGRAIIERLRTLSQPFGTQIDIENAIGVIRLGAAK